MTRTRQQIRDEIEQAKNKIDALKEQILELRKEDAQLCDDEQWYTESEEEVVISRRPKKTKSVLVGFINWKEHFKDDGTGEVITIERRRAVRKNGEWI